MNHFIDQTQNNNYGYDILRGYSTPYLSVILALIYYLYLTKEIVMRGVIFFFERLINQLIVLTKNHPSHKGLFMVEERVKGCAIRIFEAFAQIHRVL